MFGKMLVQKFSIFMSGEIHFFSENNIFVPVVASPSAPSAAAGSAPPAGSAAPPGEQLF